MTTNHTECSTCKSSWLCQVYPLCLVSVVSPHCVVLGLRGAKEDIAWCQVQKLRTSEHPQVSQMRFGECEDISFSQNHIVLKNVEIPLLLPAVTEESAMHRIPLGGVVNLPVICALDHSTFALFRGTDRDHVLGYDVAFVTRVFDIQGVTLPGLVSWIPALPLLATVHIDYLDIVSNRPCYRYPEPP